MKFWSMPSGSMTLSLTSEPQEANQGPGGDAGGGAEEAAAVLEEA